MRPAATTCAIVVAFIAGFLIAAALLGRDRSCISFENPQVGMVVYCQHGSPPIPPA